MISIPSVHIWVIFQPLPSHNYSFLFKTTHKITRAITAINCSFIVNVCNITVFPRFPEQISPMGENFNSYDIIKFKKEESVVKVGLSGSYSGVY